MANERITEDIVRSHFKKYGDIINIEEQLSSNLKIAKLLKTASKQGKGTGFPEFIITYKTSSDLILVVECKSTTAKHQSSTKDKFADFAVDGVLLYASYLAKDFDVIAIAVSGQSNSRLLISHFLQLKGTTTAINIFGDALLPPSDYLSGYLRSPEKFRQDYHNLLAFTKELNGTLHHYKVEEDRRSLLISCILIALENKAFRASYPLFGLADTSEGEDVSIAKARNAPRELANSLVDTVVNQLKSSNIDSDRIDDLGIQFSFIRADMSLSTLPDVLKELISSIDQNINSFAKTHEYFDVLGQLYIEFLRYANSDKGLGIVLTPPHITELFAELAQVNKNSVVYDNCTGTGGFLISAMRKMIANAKGNRSEINNIKQKQLVGVEYQSKIFALAVSNMYIHQDGKTNIIRGDCFDPQIMSKVKAQNPTIGFLNPPYKSDKKKDRDELEFVINNLECLAAGGTCIAIVPMQCAISSNAGTIELKKKLLVAHTLEAVLSMPDELFINSKVAVVSCVMVFTAHKPHPPGKETYFGYYKDDGFVKRKGKGRIDLFGHWELVCDKWVSYFLNRKSEAGFCVNKVVSESDEWCAEAYMETNYDGLTEEIFKSELRKYAAFKVLNI